MSILTYMLLSTIGANAQKPSAAKKISPDLFGIFFEDISYAADGGLYAELLQNRSFEYTPADKKGWQSLTAWDYITDGFGYGKISVETSAPISSHNPHYVVLDIEEEGQKGIGLKNTGFDGIVLKAGEKYDFSFFAKRLSDKPIPIQVQLWHKNGTVLGETDLIVKSKDWQKYSATITASQGDDSACLVIRAMAKGRMAIDVVSLFPQKTFRGRPNGLRADLAQIVADLHPKFMRFPGGCLVHGDGLDNMYRWKNTIGPVEKRVEQKNIWNYHQTVGLGYFEYFQFCEDIGAKPLPVVAAAVSCQNSGGTWRIGGTGQRGLPMDELQQYTQDILDLIEYANGPVTSAWGTERAKAGHPKPFNLEYVGIGNEDKITPTFKERFEAIYKVVKAKHPEITIIGTVGPFPAGEDYDEGWKMATLLNVPVVDEHYYEKANWFLNNNARYDTYNRSHSKVYVGEYASKGNTLADALAEGAYMTGLERNGDVVHLASYAPLLAKSNNTSWNPNMIYFTNTTILTTANYQVQKLFCNNMGDIFYDDIVSHKRDSSIAASCVVDSKTGDIILKLVNAGATEVKFVVDLSPFKQLDPKGILTVLEGSAADKNTYDEPNKIAPSITNFMAKRKFDLNAAGYSLNVIRIRTKE